MTATEHGSRPLGRLVALNTILLSLGRVIAAAGGVVGVAIATHHLNKGAFGQLLAGVSFVGIFQVATDLGLWTTASREIAQHPEQEPQILGVVFTIGLVLSVVTILICVAALFLLYPGPAHSLTRETIALMSLQFLLAAPGGSALAYLTAHQRAGPAALGTLLSSVLFLAALGCVVALDLGFVAIAGAYALAAFVNPIIPSGVMLRHTRPALVWDPRVAMSFARMAIPQGILLILAVVYFRIDTVLLSLLASDRDVAIYALAYKVVEFFAFLPVYFMATLFPVIARTPPRTQRLSELVSGATASLFVGGAAVLTFLVAFAPQIVGAIAPRASYHAADGVLRLLGVAALLIFVTNGFFQTLVALSRQRRLAHLTAVVLVTNVALNCALIPVAGATGAAWALIGSEVVSLVLVLFAYREVGSFPRLPRLGRVVLANLGFGASGWLVVFLLFPHDEKPVLALICGVAIGGVVYVALMRALRALPPELEAVLRDLGTRMLVVLQGIRRGGVSSPGGPGSR